MTHQGVNMNEVGNMPIENDKNVFVYWEGPEFSLITLLRRIIYKFSKNNENYKVFFLNDSNISHYIDIPSEYSSLAVNHKSDFIRANIIYKYGGIWLDSDTLVMSDLSSLFEIIGRKNGFLIKQNNDIVCTGVFGSKSKTGFLKEWKIRIDQRIKKKRLAWDEIGPVMVHSIHLQTDTTNNYEIFNGLDNVYPVNWNICVEHFLNKERHHYQTLEREYQPFIILVNSVYRKLKDKTEEEILKLDNPLAHFLRLSLDRSEIL